MSLLTVCIPTYNRKDKLRKILDSIPSDVEVIVSDNGNLMEKKFREQYDNTKFFGGSKVINMFQNWNSAILNSDSEFFLLPSDDDLYVKNAFEIIRKILNEYPDQDIYIFGHNFIDDNDIVTGKFEFSEVKRFSAPEGFELFKYGVDARMPSIVFKKSFAKRLNYLDTEFSLTAADSEFIQRCLLYGNAIVLPYIIASYRVWDGGLTSQKQSSDLWFEEINYWTNKIAALAEVEYKKIGKKFNSLQYKDEIMARNILSAGYALLKKDKLASREFVNKRKIPKCCTFRTKVALLKLLFRTYL